MSYEPRNNRECTYSNKNGKWRKLLLQRKPTEHEISVLWTEIGASTTNQSEVPGDTFKIVWFERHFPIGEPFYIWGVTMDEVVSIARRLSPHASTSFELHGQMDGFLATHILSTQKATNLDRELAKAGGV